MEGMKNGRDRVCVTGAGGFIASWVVKLLLSRGYIVHGTVRDPSNHQKNAHLLSLDKAPENLKLFKADLLDYDSLSSAIEGCIGVLHLASPIPTSDVPNPELEVIEPAVEGTVNVLKASLEAEVKRVVYASSFAAVRMIPDLPKDRVVNETCWSDEEYCRKLEFADMGRPCGISTHMSRFYWWVYKEVHALQETNNSEIEAGRVARYSRLHPHAAQCSYTIINLLEASI